MGAKLAFFTVAASIGLGCASAEKKSEELKVDDWRDFELVGSPWELGKNQILPNRQKIFIKRDDHAPLLSFEAFDFNHDGNIDALVVFDANGKPFHRVYDFDFDGTIDLNRVLK